MKSLIVVLAFFLAACSTAEEKECIQKYLDDSFTLKYNGCVVSLEVHRPATDFEVLTFKLQNETNKVLLSIYKGGAPDVVNLLQHESKFLGAINGLQAEVLEQLDDEKNIFIYEALIALPENAQGRVFYLHAQHEGVTKEELQIVKAIVKSIAKK